MSMRVHSNLKIAQPYRERETTSSIIISFTPKDK
jgi:hypothetical protein